MTKQKIVYINTVDDLPSFSDLASNTEYVIRYSKKSAQHYKPTYPIDKEVWDCAVDYVLGHKDEILRGENDYGVLLPMLNYFNRHSKETKREIPADTVNVKGKDE